MKKITLLVYSIVILLVSCTKENINSNNNSDTSNNSGNNTIVYDFSQPQLVQQLSIQSPRFSQCWRIRENNIIYPSIAEYQNLQNDGSCNVYTQWELYKNGGFKTKWFSISDYKRNHFPIISCFDIDETGSVLFVIIDDILYKCDLTISSSNPPSPIKLAQDIGKVSAVKAISPTEVVLSTDLQNGSLLKISGSETIQTLATNLINPGVFDIYNNEFFVVEKNPTGSVKKISKNGTVSNVLSNLNAPFNICFDNNGNFVLQTQWTKDGGTYQIYELYTASGTKISEVTDDQNNLIVTGRNYYMPLYVDTYNNLLFSHNALVGSEGSTYCYPNSAQMGIWKLQLKKQ
jgi:hypothetical protein